MLDPGADPRPCVVIVRGHQANPWEFGPWQQPAVAERFRVKYLRTRSAWFATDGIDLEGVNTRALRDLLPRGAVGDLAVRLPGDRYLGLSRALQGADIVHAQELGYWYSMQAARLKEQLGFKLVLTVWETIPFRAAYRNVRTRRYREVTLHATDLFLATTERARESLILEGAAPERIRVSAPGISTRRFRPATSATRQRLVVSPGRLVWEKGHQDVLRAVALLRRRGGATSDVRALIVGRGPEERRLQRYAHELGLTDSVEFRRAVPYEEMPAVFTGAACMVLASLPTMFWEEQFGMVLAEAHAAEVPILASTSGAIPEVVRDGAGQFPPGDWIGLADQIQKILAGRLPNASAMPSYSVETAAGRLADAYGELLPT